MCSTNDANKEKFFIEVMAMMPCVISLTNNSILEE